MAQTAEEPGPSPLTRSEFLAHARQCLEHIQVNVGAREIRVRLPRRGKEDIVIGVELPCGVTVGQQHGAGGGLAAAPRPCQDDGLALMHQRGPVKQQASPSARDQPEARVHQHVVYHWQGPSIASSLDADGPGVDGHAIAPAGRKFVDVELPILGVK